MLFRSNEGVVEGMRVIHGLGGEFGGGTAAN